MYNTYRFSLLFLLLANFGPCFCQGIDAPLTPKKDIIIDANRIYAPGKTFIYKVAIDSVGKGGYEEYFAMTIYPEMYNRQNIITYEYFDEYPQRNEQDSILTKRKNEYKEKTLLVEKTNLIWIHSPRSYYADLTQYIPFPEIKLPVKKGKTYKRSFVSINDPICNCKILVMKYKMKIEKEKRQYIHDDKPIEVYVITGESTNSKLGKYAVEYLYNEQLGFVSHKYVNSTLSLTITLKEQY